MARWFTRAITPPDDIVPNENDPAAVPPSTVGPDQLVTPGDPHGVTVEADDRLAGPPPRIIPSAWSGWPADWWPPMWNGQSPANLTDIAWMCVDTNSSVLSEMPPYLVNAAATLDAKWLTNPSPDLYTSWEEFIKQAFRDFQVVGEVFILATARYSDGRPGEFHVVPPPLVNVEMDAGRRRYTIGNIDVTDDMRQVRYSGSVSDAHGHGPLEAVQGRVLAARMLFEYGYKLAAGGGIPSGVLSSDQEITQEQADMIQTRWVEKRLSTLGEPAVLGLGLTWEPTQVDPERMALIELTRHQESRICYAFGVPAPMMGLPGSGDSLTYSTTQEIRLDHWRRGLKPMANMMMSALSEWALPRGTRVELNRDSYIEPEPLQRAQTAQILAAIVDPVTGQPAMTVSEIRAALRLDNSTPADVSAGVLR